MWTLPPICFRSSGLVFTNAAACTGREVRGFIPNLFLSFYLNLFNLLISLNVLLCLQNLSPLPPLKIPGHATVR